MLHKAGIPRGGHVADLGCGRGFLSLDAARMVGPAGRVTAIDRSTVSLQALEEEASSRGLENLEAVEADISSLPMGEAEADAVVARSVLSYVPDRGRVLIEAIRVLKGGGTISLFEPVLTEEELMVDWGEESAAWLKLQLTLSSYHPAFSFKRDDLVEEVKRAGFAEVDRLTWHAGVSRPYSREEEVIEEFRTSLPGKLSLSACWLEHGVGEDEVARIARRLLEESRRPSYRDILHCIYIWSVKPGTI
ncbi:MAG: class I SAM-dependent methyltransferase [Actinomycetota bacterium]|nr:class I SAM-dependent methyltransferase [Actinomycetota bacterium]